jgi:hypothetical protein
MAARVHHFVRMPDKGGDIHVLFRGDRLLVLSYLVHRARPTAVADLYACQRLRARLQQTERCLQLARIELAGTAVRYRLDSHARMQRPHSNSGWCHTKMPFGGWVVGGFILALTYTLVVQHWWDKHNCHTNLTCASSHSHSFRTHHDQSEHLPLRAQRDTADPRRTYFWDRGPRNHRRRCIRAINNRLPPDRPTARFRHPDHVPRLRWFQQTPVLHLARLRGLFLHCRSGDCPRGRVLQTVRMLRE